MTIKTFNVSNNVPMKTGYVEVLSRPENEMASIEHDDISIPNKKIITSSRDNVIVEKGLSLTELALKVSEMNVVFPSMSSNTNCDINSTFPVKVTSTHPQTSIDYRPTIVMMTDFLPIHKQNVVTDNELAYKNSFQPLRHPLTSAGDYFDVQTTSRSIRTYDAKHLVHTLRSKYKSLQNTMSLRQLAFETNTKSS
jgi:hypothetical protein